MKIDQFTKKMEPATKTDEINQDGIVKLEEQKDVIAPTETESSEVGKDLKVETKICEQKNEDAKVVGNGHKEVY